MVGSGSETCSSAQRMRDRRRFHLGFCSFPSIDLPLRQAARRARPLFAPSYALGVLPESKYHAVGNFCAVAPLGALFSLGVSFLSSFGNCVVVPTKDDGVCSPVALYCSRIELFLSFFFLVQCLMSSLSIAFSRPLGRSSSALLMLEISI